MTGGVETRALISLVTAMSFLVITVSGVVLYVVPAGRIASWIDWRFLGLGKTDWGNLHIITCFLFLIAAAVHIWLNIKPLLAYIRHRAAATIAIKKETFVALSITIFFVVGSIGRIPPLSLVLDLNTCLKGSWNPVTALEPPFGHAEQLPLNAFFQKTGINGELARAELADRGIQLRSEKESLEQIARANDTTPLEIYKILKLHEQKPAAVSSTVPSAVEQKGLGKMTLMQWCSENRIAEHQAVTVLQQHGMKAQAGQSLREIAVHNGTTPSELTALLSSGAAQPGTARAGK